MIGWLMLLVIVIAFPLLFWQFMARGWGISNYAPSSTWIGVLMYISAFLLPVLGFFFYQWVKKKNRERKYYLIAAGCLVFFLPSAFAVTGDIRLQHENMAAFPAWEKTVLTACQQVIDISSHIQDSFPANASIWTAIGGGFENQDKSRLLPISNEKRNKDVRFIALITESYQETGYGYSIKGSGMTGGGLPAVRYTWDVTVCDLRQRTIAAQAQLLGPPPPAELSFQAGSSLPSRYGIRPTAEYEKWKSTLVAAVTPGP